MKTLAEGILFCYIDNVSGRTGLCGDATRAPGRQEGFGRHLRRRDPEEGFTAFLQKRKIPGVPGGRAPWADPKKQRDWHGASLLKTTGGCPVYAEPTHDQADVPLLIPNLTNEYENTFTVIIGRNGVGKSRLLANMVNTFIKTERYPLHSQGLNDRERGLPLEPRVIAVSTSPFDKFKLAPKNRNVGFMVRTNYRYIGMRAGPFGASAISLISSATKGILDRFIEGQNLDRLPEVFNTLGLSSEVQLIYRLDFKPNFHLNEDLPKKSKIEFAYSHQTLHGLKDLGIRTSAAFIDSHLKLDDREKSKLNWAIDNLRKTISNEATISISLDFTHRGAFTLNNAMSHNIDLLESINILVNYNLIHLMDMKLHKHNYGSMSLRRASSGEQCMLVIMLGIAGNISDNSLIFIDEPEISLHPKWQEDFMPLLIKTFSKYRACQFFIATHSPQMISNLRDNNCFVTSLTKNHVFPSSYFFNMSSDFQLAELFDAPGPKNEYISRLVFSLLSKIKRNKTIDQEDRTQLSKLLLISKNLAEVDPTFELIKTAEEVVKHYATHRK